MGCAGKHLRSGGATDNILPDAHGANLVYFFSGKDDAGQVVFLFSVSLSA